MSSTTTKEEEEEEVVTKYAFKYNFDQLIENAEELESTNFSTVSFTIHIKNDNTNDFLRYVNKFKTRTFYFTSFYAYKDSEGYIERIVVKGRTREDKTLTRNINFKLVYDEGDWFYTCDDSEHLDDVGESHTKWATQNYQDVIEASNGSVHFDEISNFISPEDAYDNSR